MESTERNIQRFHNVIVNCIKSPAVVLKLISYGVITREDGTRITSLYQNGHDARASEEMLACFHRSAFPGKSNFFLMALEEEDYPHLKNLVDGKDYEDVSHEHARKMIQFFGPDLTKDVDIKDLVLELGSTGVLNVGDRERIMTTFDNKGNTYAMVCLLDLMQCRVSPSQWYYDILNALTKTGNEHVVQLLEPEFLTCPSTFMPKFGPILASGGRDTYNILEDETTVMKPLACSSTKEHIIADHADVTIYSNDLGAPPSPTDDPEVLPFSSFGNRTDSYEDRNAYKKELNVKPELIKQPKISPEMPQNVVDIVSPQHLELPTQFDPDGYLFTVNLGGDVFVTVNEFRNKVLIHVRKYERKANGKLLPTKKGASFTTSRWKELLTCLNEVDRNVQACRCSGEDIQFRRNLGGDWNISVTRKFQRVDIRKFWMPGNAKTLVPTRKGIALTFVQFAQFLNMIDDINKHIPEMVGTLSK